ncbi:type VII secretion protein EccB [Longimycelium tulufanense]|uniref:Type VII secretion protein EccB n=2 Tax=Longimycelium tulufanense TaxID=907463 RepID=A0A8J3CC31_9PSEU|nr:type VII secretion protein EccB [Longimycelium tulufanense]
MESALTRKDAVMLHEPMRTHQRALAAGAIISIVGVLGFLIFAVLSPKGHVPDAGNIVVTKSGATYVVAGSPKILVPTPNIASAKLLLMAQAAKGSGGQSFGGSPVEPVLVDDSALENTPKGPLTGIPGAPEMLPTSAEQRVPPVWSVCDTLTLDKSLPSYQAKPEVVTTALMGVEETNPRLSDDNALLVKASTGQTYLIYNNERGDHTTVRAKVDMNNQQVVEALRLRDVVPRLISTPLLNAIPEVDEITAPRIPGAGEKPSYPIGRATVGSVVKVQRAGQPEEYYVVLREGVQLVPRAVADLIRFSNEESKLTEAAPADVTKVVPDNRKLRIDDLPVVVPNSLEIERAPVTCLRWSGKDSKLRTSVSVGGELPMPKDMRPVKLAQFNKQSLENVDQAFMPPGRGAVVRSVTTQMEIASGPIFVVSDRGVKYGVPNPQIAQGLGLGDRYEPAPESILKLLPNGSPLDPALADRIYDTLPVDPNSPRADLPDAPKAGEKEGTGQANSDGGLFGN